MSTYLLILLALAWPRPEDPNCITWALSQDPNLMADWFAWCEELYAPPPLREIDRAMVSAFCGEWTHDWITVYSIESDMLINPVLRDPNHPLPASPGNRLDIIVRRVIINERETVRSAVVESRPVSHDFDGDGRVDMRDFCVLSRNWGKVE